MKQFVIALLLTCAPAPAAAFHILCAGLGGEPGYDTRFTSLVQDASKLLASPGSTVTSLTGDRSTRDALRQAIAAAIAPAGAGDIIVVTLIGHGTYDGSDFRFNLRGPDLTAAELDQWLTPARARTVVVLASSASGGAIQSLKGPNRVIVSATRSGTEKNAVVFSRFWVEALRDAAADADKNESVSALEAFRFAALKTSRYYETLKRLATEHPVLEDSGKGEGVANPSAENGQGLLAMRTAIVRFGDEQKALASPEKQVLLKRKEAVEQAIDKLKYQKAAMPLADYKKQLAALLLQLAQIQEEIEN
jgi:hypothetical protein